jgi:hypothetical protein
MWQCLDVEDKQLKCNWLVYQVNSSLLLGCGIELQLGLETRKLPSSGRTTIVNPNATLLDLRAYSAYVTNFKCKRWTPKL